MKMADSQRIEAPRQKVWEALNDPAVLKQCIPGCEELEMTGDNQMEAKVKLKVGPVKATFGGKVTLEDLNPPESYRIVGEGSGGVAGFAKGGAFVKLEEDGPEATILHYDVDAQVGGKIAQLGARLIDSTAKRLAGEFFKTFSQVVAPSEEAETSQAPAEETGEKKGWLSGMFGKKEEKPAETEA